APGRRCRRYGIGRPFAGQITWTDGVMSMRTQEHRVPFDGKFSISDRSTDPPKGAPGEKALERELKNLITRLDELQQILFAAQRHAVLAVFQALDAAGKDSTIRKVFSGVNPAGFRVHAFGRPGDLELRHDFLWRVSE